MKLCKAELSKRSEAKRKNRDVYIAMAFDGGGGGGGGEGNDNGNRYLLFALDGFYAFRLSI